MAQSKKTRTNIDLIQTANSIVDAMFPAGVAGKGPGAGSMPGGGTEKKGKLQKIRLLMKYIIFLLSMKATS